MRPPRVPLATRVRSEDSGFTLIELVFTCAVMSLIVVAIASLGETTQKHAPRDQERAHVIRDAQVGLHQMTRELRHTRVVTSYGPQFMNVLVGSASVVFFDCRVVHPQDSSLRRCVRTEGAASKVVVDRVVNEPIFTYDATRDYVQVRIEVPAKGELKDGHKHKVVLDDGVYLRNVLDVP